MVLVSEKTHFRNSLLFGFFEITVQFTRDLKNVQNEIYSNAYAEINAVYRRKHNDSRISRFPIPTHVRGPGRLLESYGSQLTTEWHIFTNRTARTCFYCFKTFVMPCIVILHTTLRFETPPRRFNERTCTKPLAVSPSDKLVRPCNRKKQQTFAGTVCVHNKTRYNRAVVVYPYCTTIIIKYENRRRTIHTHTKQRRRNCKTASYRTRCGYLP